MPTKPPTALPAINPMKVNIPGLIEVILKGSSFPSTPADNNHALPATMIPVSMMPEIVLLSITG